MKSVRIIAMLLVFSILAVSFVSCGGGDGTTAANTSDKSDGTTKAWVNDNLPSNLHYEGEQVRILSRSNDWFYDELSLEADEVQNIVDESVFNRETYVEERLGFDIKVSKEAYVELTDHADLVRGYFNSNTDVYDYVAGSSSHIMPVITDGIMYNLDDVENSDL